MELNGIVTSLLTITMAGPSVLYGLRVGFMHGMSASIHVVFCLIFLIILYSMLSKGLRMVAHASWRSEALKVVPWSETLHKPLISTMLG